MPSAVQRYKRLLSAALARYFPHTTAYLRAEREAAAPLKKPAPRAKKAPAKGQLVNTKPPAKPRRAASKPRTQGIYGPAMLAVEATQSQAMLEQVGRAVTAGLLSAPSDEQWAMIFSNHPLTRIFAGAGSGKSTTLVLRVVFMFCHLGIKPEQLTVISFTNASCAELREQLLKVLGFFNYPFDSVQARQCVRTFHSAMGVLAKSELSCPPVFCTWITEQKFSVPRTSSIKLRTKCKFSSEICTNTLPESLSNSLANNSRSRKYVKYE